MKITLDVPPSANRYWRNYQGRIVRSDEAIAYKHMTGLLCNTAGLSPLEGDVRLTLKVYRPRKKGDLDNRIKVLADALQGYAYFDDSQIAEIHAYRYDDKDCPRVEVEVTQVGM